ncbi:phosphoribosylanthranilate isomerase [Brevundimonas sp. G8]|uniref:phosphoribosylanthranilate isomerase n=1 Tax=Brevundimonas sp. G8 TaxID=1350776 RepID=UPI0012F355CE|nr:phosphoribosylanthranilate isomerase [Brevundimonas sp. G8]VXC11543.1 N-(5'-phosphoribosyl)anthranilate isomerase [Brevundimonas sp. G8]
MTAIKICGLTTFDTLDAALDAGADFVGFVMVKASPRYAGPGLASRLVDRARGRAKTVLLFADMVGPEMDVLVHDLQPDMVQLHGRETPLQVSNARTDYEIPVIKAVGVSGAKDLVGPETMEAAADHLLLDAKAPKGAAYSGGHGVAFDWTLLADRAFRHPWFLAGGLTPDNVAEALRITGAPMVDVSSGVESAPGVKDADRIAAFIQNARRT